MSRAQGGYLETPGTCDAMMYVSARRLGGYLKPPNWICEVYSTSVYGIAPRGRQVYDGRGMGSSFVVRKPRIIMSHPASSHKQVPMCWLLIVDRLPLLLKWLSHEQAPPNKKRRLDELDQLEVAAGDSIPTAATAPA